MCASGNHFWYLVILFTIVASFIISVYSAAKYSQKVSHNCVAIQASHVRKVNDYTVASWALMGVPFANVALSSLLMSNVHKACKTLAPPHVGPPR